MKTFLQQTQQHQVISFSYSKHITQGNLQWDTNGKKVPCCKAFSSTSHKSIITLLRNLLEYIFYNHKKLRPPHHFMPYSFISLHAKSNHPYLHSMISSNLHTRRHLPKEIMWIIPRWNRQPSHQLCNWAFTKSQTFYAMYCIYLSKILK